MSFAEKVHSRLLALEGQVQALDKRLKALESLDEPQAMAAGTNDPITLEIVKRKPGRPKKVVNG